MGQVIFYAALSGLALVIGAFFATQFKFSKKTLAGAMAFGSGALICALTFGLMEEAFQKGGFDAIIIGFILGGLAFIAGDYLIHLYGGRRHKKHRYVQSEKESTGWAITLGAVLDGIPESIALGVALFSNQNLGLLMLAAIFLSNVPEGLASVTSLKSARFSDGKIYGLWLTVAIAMTITAILSFIFLNNIDPNTLGILEAFAAGAMLAMLADTMMPEAYDEGGFGVGILTVFGFLTTFIVSRF